MHLRLKTTTTSCVLNAPSMSPLELSVTGAQLRADTLRIDVDGHSISEFYRHGINSWSPTAWWYTDREPWRVWDNDERLLTAEDPATDSTTDHRSYLLTAWTVDSSTHRVIVVGTLGGRTGVFTVTGQQVASAPLDPEHDNSELTWWIGIGEEREIFAAYARALADSIPEFHSRQDCGPVWSSWYSWFEEITEHTIETEVPHAQAAGYRVLQIDDGWEKTVGDWQANTDFEHGMDHCATLIHNAGMRPGLWMAPFIARSSAPIVREHPEYFIHNADGTLAHAGYNWGEPYFGLDTTHPGAQQWLTNVMKRARGWGFTYFKLDFLNGAAIPGVRYQDCDREEAYRQGLRTIRQAVPDVYIMGSGALIGSSIGLIDGMRVGPDTAPYWDNTERHRDPSGPAVRNALRNALSRYWLTSLVAPDPDVAFVRTRGSLLSDQVNAVTLDLGHVMGVHSCSDPDSWLTDSERQQIREFCQVASRSGADQLDVQQTGRFTFTINGRAVDFQPWIDPEGRISDRLLVK